MTVNDRMRRARAAQASWAVLKVKERCSAIAKLRTAIARRRQEIVDAIRADTGKTALDALAGDIMVTLEQIRYYERHAANILKVRSAGKPALLFSGTRFYESYEPHGVVLIYSPYNYPFQLAMIPLITALISGNAVILKCSDKTPRIASMIADLCAELIPGLVQITTDAPPEALKILDERPDLVFFTGSSAAGQAVAKRAAELLIPVVLELGGKDPALVFADCDLERTVEGVVFGAFSNAGQVCVGIKRLYIEESIYESFLQKLLERVGRLHISDAAEADLSALRSGAGLDRLSAQIQDAIREGARVEWPRDQVASAGLPIILSDVPQDSRLMREETFGPVLCVFSFRDQAEAIARANESSFSLSASVWTRNLARARFVANSINAGSCAINDVIRNIANPYASFGGNGQSGHGRYHGPQGLMAFSRVRSVMIASGRRKQERHWFPSTRETFSKLDRLLGVRHSGSYIASVLRRFVPLLFCAFSLAIDAQPAPRSPHLTISVNCPPGSHGDVAYLVFASRSGFPNDKTRALKSGFVLLPADSTHVSFDLGELAPGRYAVSVYQDVNGNKKLDSGLFGIPKEPVGASNNPASRLGPPRFDDCAFTMGNADQKIAISLVRVR